jgi:Skp family chaperone for outer membrane proteins
MVANGLSSPTVELLVKGALSAMFVTKLKLAMLAGGLIVTGAVVVAQQVGRQPESKTPRLPVPAISDDLSARTETPHDAAALDTAVARELGRLDLEVLTEEVQQLREQVEATLRNKLRSQLSKSGFVEDTRRAYEAARASYLASIRELKSQQLRLDALREPEAARGQSSRAASPAGNRIEDQADSKSIPRGSASAIGSIDVDAVFQNYEKVKVFREELQALTQARRNELQKLTEEAQHEEELLAKFSPGTVDFKKHENRVTELKARYEVAREQANRESTVRQAQTTSTLYRELQEATAALAKARGLDYVIKVSPGIRFISEPNEVLAALNRSVVYADPRNNLTEDVVRELNRKFKAPGPGRLDGKWQTADD